MTKKKGTMIRFQPDIWKQVQILAERLNQSQNTFVEMCVEGGIEMIDAQGEPLPIPKVVQMARAAKIGSTSPVPGSPTFYEAIERMETRLMERIDAKLETLRSGPVTYKPKRRIA